MIHLKWFLIFQEKDYFNFDLSRILFMLIIVTFPLNFDLKPFKLAKRKDNKRLKQTLKIITEATLEKYRLFILETKLTNE